jgi:hypothetical protein
MPEPLLCPSCQKPLRVPADFVLAWLTCPRCLAVVPNPTAITAEPARVRPTVTEAAGSVPVEQQARVRLCPACGKTMQPDWLFCPYCEGELRSPGAGGVDAVVRRDSIWTRGGAVLLAVLGGLGFSRALLLASSADVGLGDPTALVAVLLIFFLLFAVSIPIALLRSRRDARALGVGRIFLTTLALAGGAIVVGTLLILAALVFFLAVCFAKGKC